MKWLDLGRFILVIYSALSPITVDICQFVDSKCVSSVKSSPVEVFGSGCRLFWCFILDKGEPSEIRKFSMKEWF